MKDISIIARDVVADAAVKVAENTRPDEDQLRQVDEAAPANEWVGPDGEKRSRHEKVNYRPLHSHRVSLYLRDTPLTRFL